MLIAFPLISFKDIKILIKLNSLSILFIMMLILFPLGIGFYSFFTQTFEFAYYLNVEEGQPRYIYWFGPNPFKLCGCLSLGFFIHTLIVSIMKTNENPQNYKRDLFIGYFLTYLTYISVGVIGYIGFSSSGFKPTFEQVIV